MSEDTQGILNQSEIYQLWNIQESLLQRYRTIFLAIQAIFLSVCAGLVYNKIYPLAFVITLSGLYMLFVWRKICKARGEFVAISQWLILHNEKGFEGFTLEEKEKIRTEGLYHIFIQFEKDRTFLGKNIVKNDECFARLVVSYPRKLLNRDIFGFFIGMWAFLLLLILGITLKSKA